MSESPHKEAYAQLAELELEFDQAETELLKHQIRLFTPLYTRRSAVLSTIPTFWPMIFENFGPEIDEHISAEDWAFLGENLISLDIHRPDPEMAPRNFDIVFGFKEGNGVIKGTELRKRFVYKSLRDGDERWTGLVSEPVTVEWVNEEKDLTVGINALAAKIFEIRKARTQKKIEEKKKPGYKPPKPVKPEELEADEDGLAEFELELEEKLNQYQSFFNWFSWCGEYFMVMEKEAEKTEKSKEREEKAEEEEEEAPEFDGIDVFPNGEKIAYLFAEDMYPNALKHFADAMESNEALNADSEGADEDEDDAESIELEESETEEIMNKKHIGGGRRGKKRHEEADGEDEEMEGVEGGRRKKARK